MHTTDQALNIGLFLAILSNKGWIVKPVINLSLPVVRADMCAAWRRISATVPACGTTPPCERSPPCLQEQGSTRRPARNARPPPRAPRAERAALESVDATRRALPWCNHPHPRLRAPLGVVWRQMRGARCAAPLPPIAARPPPRLGPVVKREPKRRYYIRFLLHD